MDVNDPTLGLYHTWIAALSERFESIEVICLQEGEHHLPGNVRVHSLGKESMTGHRMVKRMRYIMRLIQFAWRLRNSYDAVFVHMNQEYLLVAGWLWKILRKPMYFWRNHYDGTMLTDIASWFCTAVLCTSRFSYTAKYRKTRFMPVGVDTSILERFEHGGETLLRTPHSILSIGRISPSKNIHLFIEALGQLWQGDIEFTADVYGKTAPGDEAYLASLKNRVRELGIETAVTFHGPLPKTETYKAYRTHEISVNASPSGMLDKTMFSGMMHGCLILISNQDLKDQIPEECSFGEGDANDLAAKLNVLLMLDSARQESIRAALREIVERNSLERLVDDLVEVIDR